MVGAIYLCLEVCVIRSSFVIGGLQRNCYRIPCHLGMSYVDPNLIYWIIEMNFKLKAFVASRSFQNTTVEWDYDVLDVPVNIATRQASNKHLPRGYVGSVKEMSAGTVETLPKMSYLASMNCGSILTLSTSLRISKVFSSPLSPLHPTNFCPPVEPLQ